MGKEVATLRKKFRVLRDVLDERARRVWAAAEANSLPRGGVSLVAKATGLSRSPIHAGIRELKAGRVKPLRAGRIRREGGGRKPLTFHQPDLLKALGLGGGRSELFASRWRFPGGQSHGSIPEYDPRRHSRTESR